MGEIKWLAADFQQERKWKIANAKKVFTVLFLISYKYLYSLFLFSLKLFNFFFHLVKINLSSVAKVLSKIKVKVNYFSEIF